MSTVKLLCKSTELNRYIATDRRWKRKQVSRSSLERLPKFKSPPNISEELQRWRAKSICILHSYIGWKIWVDDKLQYFSVFRSAAIAATALTRWNSWSRPGWQVQIQKTVLRTRKWRQNLCSEIEGARRRGPEARQPLIPRPVLIIIFIIINVI